MALDNGGGGGGAKRLQLEGRSHQQVAEAIPAGRISLLPYDLLLRILTHLSLKEAIRTGVLAREWRDLWKKRWEPDSSSVDILLSPGDDLKMKLAKLKEVPRRHLDSFSFIVDIAKKPRDLQPFLRYAAECRVEVLHVETRKITVERKFKFHLPRSSPLLARLSLRRVGISNMYYRGVEPFSDLKIILLHTVDITEKTFRKVVTLCPNLRTLDLRRCDCDTLFHHIGNPMVSLTNLRSLTVAECHGRTSLNAMTVAVPSLRSFRYSGSFLEAPFHLPRDAALADLYICFSCSVPRSRFNEALPDDLSGLTVLTICSNALSALSPVPDSGLTCQLPKLSNLHNLRELQLLMLDMAAANLADIYAFLRTCQCINIERLFVHLPELNEPIVPSLDVVTEELPLPDLDNLKIVKFMNFNRHRNEVQLLTFLLRKATSLQKVLLVSPNVALLDTPSLQQADRLLVEEALANGKILVSKSDDGATQPYHSEVFIEV